MTVTGATFGLLRTRERTARVTNVELFFDLAYVFAVTQLSHYLLYRIRPGQRGDRRVHRRTLGN